MIKFIYFIRFGLTAIFCCTLTSCGLQYVDVSPPREEARWIKDGVTKNDMYLALLEGGRGRDILANNYRALLACGYDKRAWSIAQQEAVDNCMLSTGFVFIDSPYGQHGARCNFPEYQNLPSCQSLKKTREHNP